MVSSIDKNEFICVIANIIALNAILTFPSNMTKIAGTAGWILSLMIIAIVFISLVILYKLYKPFNGKDILDIANITGGRKLEIIIGILSLAQVLYALGRTDEAEELYDLGVKQARTEKLHTYLESYT